MTLSFQLVPWCVFHLCTDEAIHFAKTFSFVERTQIHIQADFCTISDRSD